MAHRKRRKNPIPNLSHIIKDLVHAEGAFEELAMDLTQTMKEYGGTKIEYTVAKKLEQAVNHIESAIRIAKSLNR